MVMALPEIGKQVDYNGDFRSLHQDDNSQYMKIRNHHHGYTPLITLNI
jgi:hypothetical protein